MTLEKSPVVKAYCISAAIFFSFCAYAQVNDPDPELWIAGYLTGGVLLNVLSLYMRSTILLDLFAAANACFLTVWIVDLVPKLDFSRADFVWSVFEFEEGREIGGLMILLLHVLKLRSFAAQLASPISTYVAMAILSSATYVWVKYQPEMNVRSYVSHCSGAFEGFFQSNS